ncbi:hypothetical protein [Pedobacter sp. ASV28]|uniref:hypothetical protein n=1 Tax=Pedobacter sp. ASV28 TaxID=2795123 RepID=UPI0018ED7699|nr:hypothetical protein [Pedobacter sp. ASV28]
MNKKYIYLLLFPTLFGIGSSSAQTYVDKVSKDSLAILNGRLDVLKNIQKIQELKIREAAEEQAVEKLRIKLLEANDKAKESAAKNSKHAQKLANGSVNAKETAKMAKRAKNDMEESQNALDRYNKQIRKVEGIREQIQSEEKKLGDKKPAIIFDYK